MLGLKTAVDVAVRTRTRVTTRHEIGQIAFQRRHNSFIKQVMEQVKRDAEADPKLKEDWQKVQETSEKVATKGAAAEGKLGDFGESLKNMSAKSSETLSRFKEGVSSKTSSMSSQFEKAAESSETLQKAQDYAKIGSETFGGKAKMASDKAKNVFSNVMDSSSKAFRWVGDADSNAGKTKKWKESRDVMRDAAAAAQDEAKASDEAKAAAEAGEAFKGAQASADAATGGVKPGETTNEDSAKAAPEPESALVVSEHRSSSWDRFGAGLRDMPFLSSVFDNPMFDTVFGESEIAASIREMKETDYSFRLGDLEEDMEYLVAPHIIRTYLEGDQEELQKHCGEAAFAAVNASIKARLEQKLTLDPAILMGPAELQLISAKLNDKGPPSFIYTFLMQQVNCLRDADGEVVEGAIDDIRSVCYAMAVNRHPEVDKDLELQFPWQVSELAILWNQKSF